MSAKMVQKFCLSKKIDTKFVKPRPGLAGGRDSGPEGLGRAPLPASCGDSGQAGRKGKEACKRGAEQGPPGTRLGESAGVRWQRPTHLVATAMSLNS